MDVNIDVLLLEGGEALGGQLAAITHPVRNVATGWFENGLAVRAGLQAVAQLLGDRVLLEHPASAVDLADHRVVAGGGEVRARALLIATGTVPQRLPAAIDGAFEGDVTYQVERDPDRFTGRPVVVVGGGDSATLDALFLAPMAASVILAHRSETLTARHDIVARVRAEKAITDLPGWEVESVHGREHLEEVVLVRPVTAERKRVPAGGLVVKISRDPSTPAFQGQLELDRRGFIVTDGALRTSCPGVFAAGDVVSGAYWRISNALGHGSLVSRTILEYLQSGSGPVSGGPHRSPVTPQR
jgi:thioredoxin reductase (NADPH)